MSNSSLKTAAIALSEPTLFFPFEICKGKAGKKVLISELAQTVLCSSYNQFVINFCMEWQSNKNGFVVHTSGSTGIPKPIRLTREQMKNSVEATAEALNLTQNERFLICLNAEYIAGKMMLVRGMELGAEMIIIPPKRNPLEDFDKKMWFDFAAFVPMQLQTILDETPEKIVILSQMKAIIIGGAPVSYSLLKKIRSTKALNRVAIYSTYGMSETVTHIALKRLNGKDVEESADTYRTLPNVKIKTDERGCLVITAPHTLGKEIVTNDLVSIKNEKEFEWLGRADFVINTGGVKVFPEKIEVFIEKYFYELDIQKRFFISSLADEILGEQVILIIEGLPFSKKFENDFLQHLKKNLPSYHAPKQFFYLSEFLLTKTDKIDRKKSSDLILK
ncbi:acyl-CoA synthetase (AMP-forming)/AMP-acid ligase II [Bernardetia litoralis DSM 6794]|uniref:Acyl-CoA synthetase (AMP-forming)/AMP-acid ligase II n=1 Tax=Bernardetia litoralis (strain ATCC 23117 / DSM 6794 / NBRC 15988 / NCIMB 1366 / Fx l1 / Sio-4) TaxID=880071 RepID=I4AMA3_BERLS|nr:AMP-binding protein [Bernardetia litoralis]AFM05088.1 acyl-CoA synthetase (AMP-forming)/AMP-acid ligase II [Bernardetia litoralis DSM 6794]